MNTSRMAKQKAKLGDLFVIPLTDGSLAVGKVLWRGGTPQFRNSVQIGVYKRMPRGELLRISMQNQKPLRLLWVIKDCFEDKRLPVWQIVGHEPLADYEKGLTRRHCAGNLYFEDQYLGQATKEDYRNLHEGSSQMSGPTSADIHRMFNLTPDPKTVPRQDDDTSVQSEPYESSFPWTGAIEWTAALGRATSWKPVEKALCAVVKAKYAEMDECHEAVAAAEVVAAAKGKPAKDLPDEVKQWVAKHQSKFDSSLVDLAIRAVERVRADSELQQEWDESDSLNDWKKHVTGLLKGLKA